MEKPEVISTIPAEFAALLSDSVIEVLSAYGIKYCFCSKLSDTDYYRDAPRNDQGYSPSNDRCGEFREWDSTVYLAREGWEFHGPHVYSNDHRQSVFTHEVGHAMDRALGNPSSCRDFLWAMKKDMEENFPYSDEDRILLGRLAHPFVGPRELWANFFQFSLSGKHDDTAAKFFPESLQVFRQQTAHLDLPEIHIEGLSLKYSMRSDLGGAEMPTRPTRMPQTAHPELAT